MSFEEAVKDLVDDLSKALNNGRIGKKKDVNRFTKSRDIVVYWYKRTIFGFHCNKRILIRFQGRGDDIPLGIDYYQKELTAVLAVKINKVRKVLGNWAKAYKLRIGIIGVCKQE